MSDDVAPRSHDINSFSPTRLAFGVLTVWKRDRLGCHGEPVPPEPGQGSPGTGMLLKIALATRIAPQLNRLKVLQSASKMFQSCAKVFESALKCFKVL